MLPKIDVIGETELQYLANNSEDGCFSISPVQEAKPGSSQMILGCFIDFALGPV